MDIRSSLKGQFHAGLAMLRQAIEVCPEGLWAAGIYPRNFWRIAYHALFFTDFYLSQNEAAFQPWEAHRVDSVYLAGNPPVEEPYTPAEILSYLDALDGKLDERIDGLDLETEDTGFPWYRGMNKLDHVMMNFRHLQGHVGQLSELLMARGIDIRWVGIKPPRQ